MRRIMNMLVDVAEATIKESTSDPREVNEQVKQVREAYGIVDQLIDGRGGHSTKVATEATVIANFPLYFGTAISRWFYAEYAQRRSPWRDYTFGDEAPDFRAVQRMRMGEAETLVRRRELQSAEQTEVAETQITYSVDEYARGMNISWETIKNDDLSEVTRFPNKLLRAAVRFEDNYVSALYDNSTVLSAMQALGANYSAALDLDAAGLITAYSAFAARTMTGGGPLNVVPRYLVTHPIHELTCREILSGIDTTLTMPAVTRATQNLLEWRGDPYIGTTTHFYLFADPADIPAVTVARLAGFPGPRVYMKNPDMVPLSASGAQGTPAWEMGSFDSGEIEFQVQDIIGGWEDSTYVGVTDYQGMFYAT